MIWTGRYYHPSVNGGDTVNVRSHPVPLILQRKVRWAWPIIRRDALEAILSRRLPVGRHGYEFISSLPVFDSRRDDKSYYDLRIVARFIPRRRCPSVWKCAICHHVIYAKDYSGFPLCGSTECEKVYDSDEIIQAMNSQTSCCSYCGKPNLASVATRQFIVERAPRLRYRKMIVRTWDTIRTRQITIMLGRIRIWPNIFAIWRLVVPHKFWQGEGRVTLEHHLGCSIDKVADFFCGPFCLYYKAREFVYAYKLLAAVERKQVSVEMKFAKFK